MSTHDAIRRLAEVSKISQEGRDDVLDELEESDQAQIDANIDALENSVDEVHERLDELESRVERLEAEHDHTQE